MSLDTTKNLLILRMKNHNLLLIQLIGNQAFKSTIIECIMFQSTPKSGDDIFTALGWLEHLNCYLEGTKNGFLKIRRIE